MKTSQSLIQKVLLQTKRVLFPALVGVGLLAGAGLVQGGETVPLKSKVSGQITFTSPSSFTIEETGIGSHLGNFTLVGATDANGIFWFTLTTASGDQVLGVTVAAASDLSQVELAIYDGTGRFEGATGNITAIVDMDWPTLAYTSVWSGSITTVGSNNRHEGHLNQGSATVTWTKWVTSEPPVDGIFAFLRGFVGGDVGEGTFSGEALTITPLGGGVVAIVANYHFHGSKHSFTAHVDILQSNMVNEFGVVIGQVGTVNGIVTDGWLKGQVVEGAYVRFSHDHGGPTSVAFEGTLEIKKASKDKD